MHGGPAISIKDNFGYRWNAHILGAPGYVLVMTDYTGSTGYGEKFAQDIQYDPFRGPGNEILEAAADAVKRFSYIDGTRQAAGELRMGAFCQLDAGDYIAFQMFNCACGFGEFGSPMGNFGCHMGT